MGLTGIAFVNGNSLVIQNCVVRNLVSSGIAIGPSAPATIAVSNTLVAENGGHAIYVQPSGDKQGAVLAVFNR